MQCFLLVIKVQLKQKITSTKSCPETSSAVAPQVAPHGRNGMGLDCWGPVLNINRDPRWGRHGEGGTEDGCFFPR